MSGTSPSEDTLTEPRPAMMAAFMALFLAACSGGGGGSPAVTVPPPILEPSDHPQQAFADFAEQSGLQQTGLAMIVGQNGVLNARLLQDDGLHDRQHLRFDNNSFELVSNINIEGSQVFTDTSGTLDVFQTFDSVFTNWESNGRRNLFQKILVLKPGEDGIGLSYSTLAYWADALAVRPTVGVVVWGVPLRAQDMPTTGSAEYNGVMRGFMTGDEQIWELHADFDATVEFGSGSFTGAFTNGSRVDMLRSEGTFFSSHVTDLELPDRIRTAENFSDTFDWSLSGSLEAGQNLFGGTLTGTGTGADWIGQFSGSFFGSGNTVFPEELGGLWQATNPSGHVAAGGFVGKND